MTSLRHLPEEKTIGIIVSRHVRFRLLKIDKAFVLDLAKNEEDQVMVRTLVSLAQNLGLQTVAEGVEDVDALNFLGEIGCTKAQGYYLSRPLPADQFQPWLEKFSAETPPIAS